MKALICIILTVTFFFGSSCVGGVAPPPDIATRDQAKPANQMKLEQIPLPFEGQKLILSGSEVLVIGYEEFARLDSKSATVSKTSQPTEILGYLTKDGGVSFLGTPDKLGKSDLCSSDEAVFASNRLFSIGVCEHTAQFWNFDFDGRKSYTIDFTYSTYPNSDTDDAVYFPRDIALSDNEVLLASNLQKGPVIQKIDPTSPKLVTKWSGSKDDGNLLSISFVGSHGWMLTSKGNILESIDGGSNWQRLPDISQDAYLIRFRNERDGFVIGSNGLVLRTRDSGRTWIQDVMETRNNFLYSITQTDDWAAIRGQDDAVWLSSKESGSWKKLNLPGLERLNDLILLNQSLFLLSKGDLFKVELIGDEKTGSL